MLDDNTEQTHMIVAHLIPDLTNALLAPLIIAVVMFIVDWRLGVLFVVMMIVSLGLLFLTAGDTEFMRKYSAGLEKMSGEAVEYIRGMPVVKIFGGTLKSFKTEEHPATSSASKCSRTASPEQCFSNSDLFRNS